MRHFQKQDQGRRYPASHGASDTEILTTSRWMPAEQRPKGQRPRSAKTPAGGAKKPLNPNNLWHRRRMTTLLRSPPGSRGATACHLPIAALAAHSRLWRKAVGARTKRSHCNLSLCAPFLVARKGFNHDIGSDRAPAGEPAGGSGRGRWAKPVILMANWPDNK
ncbi:hypothetical protein P170DRAFT_470103 [Aspergillus steynii IBT 23096]|uniref:Uncharacterized protein n=1 Tax=Aspergillus steynii IBT 23096 TaxID=1392250 RepID=A0A2I2GP45_9EURO|nr:uncharacterized protein P170DRAFT_470103 [Aspergillus steynii IBT 23096]PLB54651.1 hypothetical protein P170DRAFT_470103 [Aspergillus steynii IBT 23096]